MASFDISLDIRKGTVFPMQSVTVRVGDIGSQTIRCSLLSAGAPFTPDGMTARLDILKADGTWARCSASVSGSMATCTLPPQAVSSPGLCRLAHFVLLKGDSVVESTDGFMLDVLPNVETRSTPGADGYDDQMESLYRKWLEFEARAEREFTAAQESRSGAYEKAESARESKFAGAEAKRSEAEGARSREEAKRSEAEKSRASAEDARTSAEAARASSEKSRASAEAARASAEGARASAEKARADEEGERAAAERARAAEETKRSDAEKARASAEGTRVSAEAKRDEAERRRKAAQDRNDANQAANDAAVRKLSPVVLEKGQYDPETLAPTVPGEANRMYFVPMTAPAAYAFDLSEAQRRAVESGNLYMEWMWIASKWECVGQSVMEAKPIQTGEIDRVASGQSPSGDSVLSLTGLSYLWAKLKSAFASAVHRHRAADVDGLDAALAEKAAKAHQHAVSDVSGLQSSLDGKAEKSHSHGISGVSGLQSALDGKAAKEHAHAVAAASADGFMSKADKAKLDGIATGATKVAVDSAMSSSSTNPVQNKIVNAEIEELRNSMSRHPVGEMIWLMDGKTPSSIGRPGEWMRVDVAITTPGYNVLDIAGGVDRAGSNVQIYYYNKTETQHWHLFAETNGKPGGGQYWPWICVS